MRSESLVLLVVVAGAIGFLLILLVGRGQRHSPALPRATQPADDFPGVAWVRSLGIAGFQRLLLGIFEEMGFQPGPCERTETTVEFFAIDPTPIRGARIFVHGLFGPAGVPVDADEVRALVDASRAELAGKAVLVTLGRFADDAREAAREQPIDLVDGEALAALVRRYLPQAHATRAV